MPWANELPVVTATVPVVVPGSYKIALAVTMIGMLVMGIGYIVYGFIAPRFVAAPAAQGAKA